MGALFDFKCTCDSTFVYVCQADVEKCIFVWTILSQTPRRTPQVTFDAGRISARIFLLFPKERRMLRKRDYQGRLSFHFFDRWMTDLATHRQKKVQAMSWKNLQMLEFFLFTWSWMGPINCAPNPKVECNSASGRPQHRGVIVWLYYKQVWNNCFISLPIDYVWLEWRVCRWCEFVAKRKIFVLSAQCCSESVLLILT